MNTSELVEWQKYAPNGLVYPWWTHPFLDVLEIWDLKDKVWLEFGGGRSTAWLRSKCKMVVTIESNSEWANQAMKDCEDSSLWNGRVCYADLPDGVQERKQEYFELIPTELIMPDSTFQPLNFDIISIDGIWRYECLEWALNHFKGREGIIIADNWQQDYVWISQAAEELMKSYKMYQFYQPGHTNHEGRPWSTVYWIIE